MTAVGRRPIDAAVIYARRGWPVFPCHTPTTGPTPCSCGDAECSSVGKHPRVRRGLHDAGRDETQLRSWWGRWPRANVAIRTGAASGLVVVDIDPDHGGDDTIGVLEREHGPLPLGRSIRTGSGGRHLYYRHPGGHVPNNAGTSVGPGVDIRGDGGYVIAPPSRHESGGFYAVVCHGGVIPQLPEWLLERLRPPSSRRRSELSTGISAPSAWAEAAARGELARLDAVAVGARNDTLNRVAFRLGQIVASGLLDEATVASSLTDRGLAIGLSPTEVAATVRSGLRAGASVPRGAVGSQTPSDAPMSVDAAAGH